jgi:phage-related baseplate assembly protein
MSRFSFIDLSALSAPDVVEPLSYESVLAEMTADLIARDPGFDALLESDTAIKVLESCAYRDFLVRQRVNDAARRRMLAFATGADLDHLGADVGVERLLLDAGDPDAIPPVAPIHEDDDAYRLRIQLGPEALTTAGSEGSYVFNALTAGDTPSTVAVASPQPGVVTITYTFDAAATGGRIKDVDVDSPEPGSITVTLLGHDGDGEVAPALIATVEEHLSAKYVRPLCDEVTVQSATIVGYSVDATLEVYDGPDQTVVLAAAEASLDAVAAKRHAIGEQVTGDVLDAALHVSGVRKVTLNGWVDVICAADEAPYMTGATIGVAGA